MTRDIDDKIKIITVRRRWEMFKNRLAFAATKNIENKIKERLKAPIKLSLPKIWAIS